MNIAYIMIELIGIIRIILGCGSSAAVVQIGFSINFVNRTDN